MRTIIANGVAELLGTAAALIERNVITRSAYVICGGVQKARVCRGARSE